MMEYLFMVSIGPVQDFINSARRTRDLAFGSWLLSELSRAAAHRIREENGVLIFPAPPREEMLHPYNKEFNVANKIIALMQGPPQASGEKGLGELVYDAITDRLDEIRKQALT